MSALMPEVWQQAAETLVGRPVRVRRAVFPYVSGLACYDPDGEPAIELGRSLKGGDLLDGFLHECGHHVAVEVYERPTADKLFEIAAELSKPGASAKYKATKSEVKADAYAKAWRERIDEVTWSHPMDVELKLRTWLRTLK